MNWGSFFASTQGTSGGSGKGGGAGYSSDVSDSGKSANDISVIVGGIGTQSQGAAVGGGAGGFNPTIIYGLIAVVIVLLVVKR